MVLLFLTWVYVFTQNKEEKLIRTEPGIKTHF